MSRSFAIAAIAILLAAGAARADDPDFGRAGWYAGIGGGAGFDFFKDAIDDLTTGAVDISPGGSFNARGGYRLASWFALEVLYEGVYGMDIEVRDTKVAEFKTHSFVGNLKLIAPIWRTHPYIMVGPGAQLGDFDGKGAFSFLDTNRWDFMIRTAIGLDGYITESWLINLEVAPSIRFADYGNIPSETTDNITLTAGIGFQYRF